MGNGLDATVGAQLALLGRAVALRARRRELARLMLSHAIALVKRSEMRNSATKGIRSERELAAQGGTPRSIAQRYHLSPGLVAHILLMQPQGAPGRP
jgi:hypothetical protein